MFRRLLLALCFVGTLGTAQATNIHVRFFESADTVLTEDRFQLFSLAALEDENITIVVYGLTDELVPAVTLFDTQGNTLQEDLNPDNDSVAVVQATIPENGLYTFLVSRQSDVGGLVRIMAFEGEPYSGDLTIRDTIDPFLPSRAFFAEGDPSDPVVMQVELIEDDSIPENLAVTEVFASRGTNETLPPLDERMTPVQVASWENERGDVFYTLNVRPTPEQLPSANRITEFESVQAQTVQPSQFLFNLGEGSEEIIDLARPVCSAVSNQDVPTYAGPSFEFPVIGQLATDTPVELVGQNDIFYLIIDLNSDTGGSWVEQDAINVTSGIDSENCGRVQAVNAPMLEDDGDDGDSDDDGGGRNPGGGGNSGGGGPTVFGLPPAGEPASDEPLSGEEDPINRPQPVTPEINPGAFSIVFINCFDDGIHWNVTVQVSNPPPEASFVSVDTGFNTSFGSVGVFIHDTLESSVFPTSIIGSVFVFDSTSNIIASAPASIACP